MFSGRKEEEAMVQNQANGDGDGGGESSSSFLSWRTTLNPMAARFRHQPNNNSIVAAYEEIRSYGDNDYYDHEDNSHNDEHQGLPVAMNVVAVEDDDHHSHHHHHIEQQHNQNLHHGDPTHVSSSSSSCYYRPQPWRHSNLIDLIIGGLSALCAFITTIKIEFAAFIIYALAVGSHNVAEKMACGTNQSRNSLLIFRSIFMLLAGVFMFVDSILLLVSVLVTEILAAVALFLCAMFGGRRSGTEWQQFIRRTCHLTRWGFRSCLVKANWKPDRIFPIPESVENGSLSGFEQQQAASNSAAGAASNHDHFSPGPSHPSTRHVQQLRQYSDDYCARNDTDRGRDHDDDDEITMSTLTTTTTTAFASATHVDDHHADGAVVIPSDNVHVIVLEHDDFNGSINNDDDDDTDPFAKTSQRVVID
mmetsp:Transcript_19440/g.46959  ORF Transcript_19440/g.46959 Transcript_19440/m.46959 type:complete len:419 (+) Transcript_19440:289-1545(+)